MGGVGEGMNMLKIPCMEFSKKNSNENTQIHRWFSFLLVFFLTDTLLRHTKSYLWSLAYNKPLINVC